MSSIKENLQSRIVTLRFSILSIFISLFVIAIITIVAITYLRFSRAIETVSFRLMREVSSTVFDEIAGEIDDVSIEAKFGAYLLQQNLFNADNQQEIANYTYGLMTIEAQTLPSVQSAIWGDEKGNYILSSKLEDQTISTEIVDTTKNPSLRKLIIRNIAGMPIKDSKPFDLNYDPRLTQWYQSAKTEKKLIWTDVYKYPVTNLLGITAAVPVYKKEGVLHGVFALNIRLDYLRHLIEAMKVSQHGIVLILTESGKVIAYPHLSQYRLKNLIHISEFNNPWLTRSFIHYQENKKPEFAFDYLGEKYLAVYQPIPSFTTQGWFIAVVVPQDDFTIELVKTNFLIILIGIIILISGILLMSNLVNRIVRPLKKLVKETEKIKNFELENTGMIDSQIKEVKQLSHSIYSMKKGLRSFKKYVPATLVRNLIEAGEDISIGGEKKQLAIFFSDIEDFTVVSEQIDPDQLMVLMCQYFDEFTHIISDNQGTIDKYIGDSVMAFWGAPLSVERPCHEAALSALQCLKRLKDLNEMWIKNKLPPLYTRIGLHFGEAIVGNLGSNERFNYTAIGDVINVTKRLESINKVYKTNIIVSDNIYKSIKNEFVLRMVDFVAVKGRAKGTLIYELLGQSEKELTFDLAKYRDFFDKGFEYYQQQNWEDAIHCFQNCLLIYPKDNLAPIYILRCQNFLKNPPPKDWNGMWKMV